MREGYKNTEVGVIPEDWEVYTLDELINKRYIYEILDGNHGALYPRNEEFVDSGVPYISANSINRNKIDFTKAKYLTVERANKFKKGVAKNGDVLFAHNATVGPVALLGTKDEKVILSTSLTYYRVNNKLIYNKYLMYYMSSNIFAKQYFRRMGQTTRNQVPITVQKEFYHILPPLKEQEKISEILSTVDSQIDDTEKLIEKSKELKKGLMQKLLTKGIGHSEFKNTQFGTIPNDWNTKKIGDIYDDLKAGSTPSRAKPEFFTGDIPWITSGELKNKYISKTYENITNEAVENANLRIYPPGTFFIAITGLEAQGTRGSCGINSVYATTNQSCLAFLEKDEIYPEFLYYWYLLHGEYIGIKYTQGTKQQSLNNKIVEEFEIGYPNKEEQYKIVQILSSVDSEIEEYENKKQKLEELKKGLMQQLLTGKVRTI